MTHMPLLRIATSFFALAGAMLLAACATNLPSPDARAICALCPAMSVIETASFTMGADIFGKPTEAFDGPAHYVALDRFAVSQREVTVGDFKKFVQDTGYAAAAVCQVYEPGRTWFPGPGRSWQDPGYLQGDDHPVVCVSWNDAKAYVAWLKAKTGLRFRLLSEAEWEYLAATGQTNAAPLDLTGIANHGIADCCGPSVAGRDTWKNTAPVASFPPDRHGLYDIMGNVWEWMEDCYAINYFDASDTSQPRLTGCDATRRITRGGSWGDAGKLFVPTYRLRAPANMAYFTLGFRVARALPQG